MPRTSSKGQIVVDEDKLIELVKLKPELYDTSRENFNNIDEKKIIWKDIADQLDAPAELCKKVWKKLKDHHTREIKAQNDRRRSLRLGSREKNLGFLDTSSIENSNENSRASSNCGSPKANEKRRLRSSSRSLSQLTAISETDLASLVSVSSADTVAPNDSIKLETSKTTSHSAGRTPRKLNFPSELRSNDTTEKFQILPLMVDGNLRSHLSEPSHLTSKEVLQSAVDSTPRRQSGGLNGRKAKKSPFPTNSTRAFFDSMALTVSTFPQHVQAAVRVQICNIVSEIEYELSSPKTR